MADGVDQGGVVLVGVSAGLVQRVAQRPREVPDPLMLANQVGVLRVALSRGGRN